MQLKDEIATLYKNFESSWAKKDGDSLGILFHDKACIMAPDTPTTYGKAGIKRTAERNALSRNQFCAKK